MLGTTAFLQENYCPGYLLNSSNCSGSSRSHFKRTDIVAPFLVRDIVGFKTVALLFLVGLEVAVLTLLSSFNLINKNEAKT